MSQEPSAIEAHQMARKDSLSNVNGECEKAGIRRPVHEVIGLDYSESTHLTMAFRSSPFAFTAV